MKLNFKTAKKKDILSISDTTEIIFREELESWDDDGRYYSTELMIYLDGKENESTTIAEGHDCKKVMQSTEAFIEGIAQYAHDNGWKPTRVKG